MICSVSYQTIYGLNASVQATEFGQAANLTVTIDAGTEIKLFIDWGDGILSESHIAKVTDLEPSYNHTYANVGDYIITVRASNDRNSLNVTIVCAVDVKMQGLNYTLEHAVIGSPIKDYIEASEGTRISVFWNYGNGIAEEKYYANATMLPTTVPHSYQYNDTIAVYNLTVFISNSLGVHKFELEAAVSEKIKDLKVCKTDPVNVLNPNVSFTQTITAGRHMTCGRYFGDEYLWIIYHDEPPKTQTFTHTYPAKVGRYDFVLRCYNFLDYFIFIMRQVFVVIALDGGSVDIPDPSWHNQRWDSELNIPFSFTNGTNATCYAIFDGNSDNVSISFMQSEIGRSNGTYTRSPESLSLGQHTLDISCTNLLGSHNFSQVIINVQKAVTNLTLSPVIQHLEPNQNFIFYANTSDGSVISYSLNFGDSSSAQTSTMNNPVMEGSYQHSVTYAYTQTGYFTVTVTATNNVSTAIATTDVGIEKAVPADISITSQNVTRPSEIVQFTVSHPAGGKPDPDSTRASWDFLNNGTTDMEEDMVIKAGTNYVVSHTYSDYGDFVVKCTIFNNVSSVSVTVPFRVGVAIENFYCEDINPFHHEIHKEMQFSCHVDKGSEVIYKGEFDDISSVNPPVGRTSTVNWNAADDKIIPKIYLIPGYYKANFSAENVFGFANTTVDLFIFEQIQGLTLIPLIKYLQPTQPFTFYANITNGSKVEFEFEFSDGSNNQTKVMDEITGEFNQMIQYAYTKAEYFTVGVTAKNNVSSAIAFTDIGVEYPVPDEIVLTVTNVTRPAEAVIFNVSHPGGNVPNPNSTEAIWDYLNNGSSDLNGSMIVHKTNPYVHSHLYSNYGDFEAKVTIFNNLSAVFKTVPFRVGVKLESFSVGDLHRPHERSKPVKFYCYIEQGSTVNYEIQFGDSTNKTVPRNESLHWDGPDNTTVEHTYHKENEYTVWFSAINNTFVFPIKLSKTIIIYAPVSGVKLNSSHQYAKVSESVTFHVYVLDGTWVFSKVDLGGNNGQTNEIRHRFHSEEAPVKFTETFTNEGNYSLQGLSKNEVSNNQSDGFVYLASGLKFSKIIIQIPVETIKLVVSHSIVKVPDGRVQYTVQNTGSKKPTDLFCDWSFPDGSSDRTYAGELMANLAGQHVHYHTFPIDFVGTHKTTVNCSNYVSSAVAEVTVIFQQEIGGAIASPVNGIVKINDESSFNVYAVNGSHLKYDVTFKDGTPKKTYTALEIDKLNGSVPFLIKHVYSTSSNYSVDIKLYNNVSEQLVSLIICVQRPLLQDSISIKQVQPVKYPYGDMTFTVEPKPGGPFPDNVFLFWDFGNNDESTDPDFAYSITLGKAYLRNYRYQNPQTDTYQVVVNASNRVSFIQITTSVEIMHAVAGFKMEISSPNKNRFIEAGVVASINASVTNGSKVNYNITFGDGVHKIKTTSGDHFLVFNHTYNTAKNYSVRGEASNLVSKMQFDMGTVYVQNKIKSDVLIQCDPYILMDRTKNEAILNVTIKSGTSPNPSNVHFRFTPDTGENDMNLYADSLPFTYHHVYSYSSNMNTHPMVSVHIYNKISNKTHDCKPEIQDQLSGFALSVPLFATTNNETLINVTLTTGTYFTLRINYGDGEKETYIYNETTTSIALTHTYSTPGVKQVNVSVTNNVGKVVSPIIKFVRVQNPVPDLSVLSANITPISVQYEFKLAKINPNAASPTNASLEIDFGDGSVKVKETQFTTNNIYKILKQYTTNGSYDINIVVKNNVSEKVITHTVIAEEIIKSVIVTVSNTESGKIYGTNDPIPVLSTLTFSVSVAQGTNVNYKWSLESKIYSAVTFSKYFPLPGNFAVNLEAWNALNRTYMSRNFKIVSSLDIESFIYGPSAVINQPADFKITTKNVTDAICFELTFNSTVTAQIQAWVGFKSMCEKKSKLFSASKFKEYTTLTKSFTYTHKFDTLGKYNISLQMMTESITSTIHDPDKPLTVEAQACNSPNVSIVDQNIDGTIGTRNNPISFKKSSPISAPKMGINIVRDCAASNETIIKWEMYKVNGGQEILVNYTDDIYRGSKKPDRIEFPAKWMPYGTYRFYVIVSMNGFPLKSNSKSFYIIITESTLVTSLTDYQRRGSGQILELNAEKWSFDPDVDPTNKEGIKYEWYCDVLNASQGGLDEAFVKNHNGTIPTITLPDVPRPPPNPYNGGCFGDGPGKLDVQGGKIVFNTENMKSDESYLFVLKVSKGTRAVYATSKLEVTKGQPPEMTVSCYDKTLDVKVCSWKYVTATLPYKLLVACSSCSSTQNPSLLLSVSSTGQNKRKKRNVDSFTNIKISKNSATEFLVDIPKDTFISHLGQDIELLFTMKIQHLEDGKITKKIKVDNLPHSGTFTVKPITAQALSTVVEMTPKGWKPHDPEQSEFDLSYKYEYCLIFTDLNAPENCTALALSKTTLSQGLPENNYQIAVRVQICDPYFLCTYSSTLIITVNPPADGAADKALANAMASTNPTAVFDALTTISVSITQPVSSSSGSAGSNYAQQSAAQKAEAEAAAKAAAEAEAKKNAQLASIVVGINAMTTSSSGGAAPLTLEQKMQAISSMTTIAKKLTAGVSSEAKLGSMSFVTAMTNDLSTMDPNQRAGAITGILSVAGSIGTTVEVTVVIKAPTPVNLDLYVDEAEQERLAKLEAERKAQEKATALSAANSVTESAYQIAAVAKVNMEVNGAPMVYGSASLQVTARMADASSLSNTTYSNPEFDATLPQLSSATGSLFMQMVYVQANMYSFDDSAAAVGTGVTQMSVSDDENKPVDMKMDSSNPVKLSHKTKDGESNWADMSNASRDSITSLVYFHVPVDVNNSAYISCLKPGESGLTFAIYVKFNVSAADQIKPNETNGEHDFSKIQPEVKDQFCFMIPQNLIHAPGFYVGIALKVTIINQQGQKETVTSKNATVPKFEMNSLLSRCRAWDSVQLKWVTDKCTVGKRSTVSQTECECTELSSSVRTYAGGVTVPQVNTINFANVFGNFAALLAGNPTVFAVMISVLSLYILFGIWSRYKDKADIIKWGVLPLVDNKKHHNVYYKISIFTGMRRGAGSKSKVCFILSGENGDTGVRIADDGKGKHFARGSVRHFAMGTDFDIGAPTFLRIWHDNSGEGDNAGWFLDKIAVENLQTRSRSFFFCSQWLAADEDDGQVDRMIPVAGSGELENFNKLFFSKARKSLTDDHLWLSILSRPTKSTFTRLQRLTCAVSLLFTTMLANAMFFRTSSEAEASAGQADTKLQLGPITISVNTLLVSIFGALVVIPVTTIIITFFRKSRPKNWKDEDENELEEIKQNAKKGVSTISLNTQDEEPKKKKVRFWKKKYPLPYQCLYIAWGLAILSIITSAFFVILYSLEWGETKSLEWLSTLVLSFVQSVVLVQPIKIVFVAALISLIFKTFDEMDDDKENKETNAKPLEDEKLEDNIIRLSAAPVAYIPKPPSKSRLEHARKMRIFEKKMWGIVKEAMYYFLFLILLSFVAWGNKESIVYSMNSHIKRVINLGPGGSDTIHGDAVLTGHDYWKWLKETAIPAIFFDQKYNGNLTTVRDRSFMSDQVSYRVGAMRLRQSRVLPGSCTLPEQTKNLVIECNTPYTMGLAETRNFTVGWFLDLNGTNSNLQNDQMTKIQKSFKYFNMIDLKNLPYFGWMATYSGGGYVAELGTSSYQALKLINQLIEHSWIDYYTRAVFVEFTVYNPSLNLFAYVNYLMEFPATGGVWPSERITSFQVYSVVAGMGAMVVACQLIYCVVLVYFIIKEILKIRKEKKAYFLEPWNVLEIAIIVGSIVAIAMFVLREQFGRMVMSQLKADKEQFTNYSGLALYNENIDYVVGFLVFLANIKFLRLLRFNKHIAELADTLKIARVDIGYFFLTSFIIFMGFGMWGNVIFGKKLYTFSNYIYTFETMFSMLIGKFDLNGMEQADPNMGKLYFITFTLVVFFVLVNMFVGILTMAYEEVRLLPKNPMADYKVIGFFVKKIKKLLRMKVESEKHGEGYLSPSDVIQLRLTAIDQHITHMYNESIQEKKKKSKSDIPKIDLLDASCDNANRNAKLAKESSFLSKIIPKSARSLRSAKSQKKSAWSEDGLHLEKEDSFLSKIIPKSARSRKGKS